MHGGNPLRRLTPAAWVVVTSILGILVAGAAIYFFP